MSRRALVFVASFLFALTGIGDLASAGTLVIPCGATIKSIVLANNNNGGDIHTKSTTFVDLPDGKVTLSVPSGLHCIKVRFSAVVSCKGGATNSCLTKVLYAGSEFAPTQEISFDGQTASRVAQSFDWVIKVPGGADHTVKLVMRVGEAPTVFRLFSWTMNVELTN